MSRSRNRHSRLSGSWGPCRRTEGQKREEKAAGCGLSVATTTHYSVPLPFSDAGPYAGSTTGPRSGAFNDQSHTATVTHLVSRHPLAEGWQKLGLVLFQLRRLVGRCVQLSGIQGEGRRPNVSLRRRTRACCAAANEQCPAEALPTVTLNWRERRTPNSRQNGAGLGLQTLPAAFPLFLFLFFTRDKRVRLHARASVTSR